MKSDYAIQVMQLLAIVLFEHILVDADNKGPTELREQKLEIQFGS